MVNKARKRREWKAAELRKLFAEYPSTPTTVLAVRYNTNESMLHYLASRFGVKKNPDYRAAIARQNALSRYDKQRV